MASEQENAEFRSWYEKARHEGPPVMTETVNAARVSAEKAEHVSAGAFSLRARSGTAMLWGDRLVFVRYTPGIGRSGWLLFLLGILVILVVNALILLATDKVPFILTGLMLLGLTFAVGLRRRKFDPQDERTVLRAAGKPHTFAICLSGIEAARVIPAGERLKPASLELGFTDSAGARWHALLCAHYDIWWSWRGSKFDPQAWAQAIAEAAGQAE